MKHRLLLPALALVLLPVGGTAALAAKGKDAPPPVLPLPAEPAKTLSAGAFRDASGQEHRWQVTPAHLLEWDGLPYLPVGGAFQPRYWQDRGQTDDAWAADKAALDALKTHGVHDLYLYAGPDGLTHVPVAAVQKVIDYLDGAGFRYGLEIADFPKDPLVGYVVKPSVYRDPSPPADGSPVRFAHIPGLVDAVYMLASKAGLPPDETGDARIVGGDTAEIALKRPDSGDVVLLYPQRLFLDGTPESRLPDLWQGYDEYRDRLLTYFGHLKLGKGFRFFLDPLTDRIGFDGDIENVIPTTDGFRLDFQAWLERKYGHNVDDLNKGWGIKERDLPDFATAARCIPLWFQARGLPAVFDPAKRVPYEVLGSRLSSSLWDDLKAFRIESTRDYMNAIADVLKKSVADVPVVYKWTQFNPLFTNTRAAGGYDGLGLEVYGHGRELVTQAGAYAFAQAEAAPKTTWLIVSGTGPAARPVAAPPSGPAPAAGAAAGVYPTKTDLFSDWNELLDVGARGFFTQALQRLPADRYAAVNMAGQPEQLDWLGAYAASLVSSAPVLGGAPPRVLWYPYSVAGLDIGVRELPGGVWWLPTFQPGAALDFGSELRGYSLSSADGSQPIHVLWSPHGALSQVRVAFPKTAHPVVTDPAGAVLSVSRKRDLTVLPVGADPVVIRRVAVVPIPQDVTDAAADEVRRLLKLAQEQNVSHVEEYQNQLFYALNKIPDEGDLAEVRYNRLEVLAAELMQELRPYAWIEAEGAQSQTFDALVPDPGAAGGAYLSLDTDRTPPRARLDSDGGYQAQYQFRVNAPGRYALWMAGSPVDSPAVSPFTFTVDNGGANDAHDAAREGAPYADGKFVWSRLGDVTLTSGSHKLTIALTGPRPSDGRYVLALDAFCLSRVAFHPDGPHQPPVDAIPPPEKTARDKGKR